MVSTKSLQSCDALARLHWLALEKRRACHKVGLIYKCLNSMAPGSLSDSFKKQRGSHYYNIRNKDILTLPVIKHNFGKNTFSFSGAKLFNDLPREIRTTESLKLFTILTKQHYT